MCGVTPLLLAFVAQAHIKARKRLELTGSGKGQEIELRLLRRLDSAPTISKPSFSDLDGTTLWKGDPKVPACSECYGCDGPLVGSARALLQSRAAVARVLRGGRAKYMRHVRKEGELVASKAMPRTVTPGPKHKKSVGHKGRVKGAHIREARKEDERRQRAKMGIVDKVNRKRIHKWKTKDPEEDNESEEKKNEKKKKKKPEEKAKQKLLKSMTKEEKAQQKLLRKEEKAKQKLLQSAKKRKRDEEKKQIELKKASKLKLMESAIKASSSLTPQLNAKKPKEEKARRSTPQKQKESKRGFGTQWANTDERY
eukprot:gnl/TRDRNA2_/TRDRNA2_73746_c0_seq2.p1 gnl/TRDRNA2_/TRDRNA2_73746_c0~~gnl/TRDRNA2_/TRDRNA2_73746_c0_seq2.p1  ORF type:complete len:311 (+),score=81.20 gnl/TRDRNA2_/TRDRNA2_73746_c0_seq2:42-974(+)